MRRPSPGVRGLPSLTMRRVMGPPPGSRRLAYHSGAPIVRRSRKGNPMDIVDVIRRFNADRDPERLEMKYARMRTDAFSFLRGSCHLFHARRPSEPVLRKSPAVWCCGDMHLENFGSYKGDNRQVYFDLNDFDEALLAPLARELRSEERRVGKECRSRWS